MISVGMLRDVWAFRGFILGSVKREFQSRYSGTQFGMFWLVAHPLTMILIYTIVFARLMKTSLPNQTSEYSYSIYLCAGVIAWGLFAELLSRSVNIFLDNAAVLKKINFPKLCLPIIVVASGLLHYFIVCSLFVGFLVVINGFPGFAIVGVLPVLIVQVALAMGLGILLATVNVFYRDVGQSVGVVLQFWFWLTPVVYVPSVLPEQVRNLLEWNPVWPLIRAYQEIFLDGKMPGWVSLIYPASLAVVLVFLGMFGFLRLQGQIVDEL